MVEVVVVEVVVVEVVVIEAVVVPTPQGSPEKRARNPIQAKRY